VFRSKPGAWDAAPGQLVDDLFEDSSLTDWQYTTIPWQEG
jgi:hypothetical protein